MTAVVALVAAGCTSPTPTSPDPASPRGVSTLSPSPATATATPDREGGSLRIGLSADPVAVDPAFIADAEGDFVADALFDSLVALDEDLEVVPAAASSWSVSEDATQLVFRLRRGAEFHDGTPVAAESFVRAFTRIADGTAEPRSFGAYRLESVAGFEAAQREGTPLEGVEALDERTLRITLRRPDADFLRVLTDPALAPVPPGAARDPEFGERPVGNGPFEMAQPWQHDQFIRLDRFDGYPSPALLEEVVFQIYPEDPGSLRQYGDFEEGGLDVAAIPPTRTEQAIETYGHGPAAYEGPGVIDDATTTVYYYGFDLSRPPFDDPTLRRAVSLVIDREDIVENIMQGTRLVADSIVPPPIPGSRSGTCAHCRFAPAEARALLDAREEPLELDEPIRLVHNDGRSHRAIAQRIADQIRRTLDLPVEIESQALQPFVETLRAGEADLFRFGWQGDHPSMGAYLRPLFSRATIGSDNLVRYDVPEVDELLTTASAEGSPRARRRLWQQAEERILGDVAIAPIMFYRHATVVAEDVRDFRLGPMGDVSFTEVWLDREA